MSTDIRGVIIGSLAATAGQHVGLRVDTVLADLDAAGVVLLADLPEVVHCNGSYMVGKHGMGDSITAEYAWKAALAYAAIARHLESEPDPADVEALAELMADTDGPGLSVACHRRARKLLRSGRVSVTR